MVRHSSNSMLPNDSNQDKTELWHFRSYVALAILILLPILLLKMPKRKAGESATATVRLKKVREQPQHYSGTSSSGPSPVQQNIRKLFDKYRDDATNEPDKIGLEGTQNYTGAITVALDEVALFALFDLLEAPSFGEFSRDGFVNGWHTVSTPSNACDTEAGQKTYLATLRDKIKTDPSYFRQVYKSTFKYAKPEDKRAVPADEVFAYWDMFFGGSENGGIEWNSAQTKWYDLWKEYYRSKNNRPVNRDLWNQVAELVSKTRQADGESLNWWSEDGAWPTAVDDFVAFVKEHREKEGGSMDTT